MGFNGKRLRNARIFRNMTISELAEKIDVTKQAISQYEKDIITPKPDVLFSLVTSLRFPVSFFSEKDDLETNIENTFFRALGSTKTLDLNTQETKTQFIVRIYNFFSEYLNFPKLDLPKSLYFDYSNPEEAAKLLRNFWQLGNQPITNMVSLLEKKGIIVSALTTESNKIDAFTQIHSTNGKKQYCIVLGNDKQSFVRRNFDAAHELGHIILHDDLIHIKELSNEEFKKIEKEANQFAASFLLPEDSFYMDLVNPTNLNAYKALKKKWKVSISAMVMRAKQVGRINTTQYQNLMKNISYKKWRKNEPFDDEWALQRPQLFKKAIKILENNDVLSSNQIISELANRNCSMNARDIEMLLDLEPDTLATKKNCNNSDVVISLR